MNERRAGIGEMQEQLDTLTSRVSSVEDIQKAHMEQTARIEVNTKDLIETFTALKGAWVVLDWIGKLAKPLALFASLFGGWFWLKDHWKDLLK